MASASTSSASPPNLLLFIHTQKPIFSANINYNQKVFPPNYHVSFQNTTSTATKFHSVKAMASPKPSNRNIKPNSVICGDCDGNGAVLCSQCKGSGVNSVDFFNGQFKAGDSCWLCGGRKEMLCGNCNGAGFVGGFMSTYDE